MRNVRKLKVRQGAITAGPVKTGGSITVEASVVVTVALLLTFFVFFMAAYLYDIHRLQACITKAALEVWTEDAFHKSSEGKVDWEAWEAEALLWRMTDDFSQKEEEVLAELTEDCEGLWFGNECDFDVSISASSVSLSYEGVYYFPISTGFGDDNGMSFGGGVTYSRTESEEWIRIIGGVVRGLGGEEDVDD